MSTELLSYDNKNSHKPGMLIPSIEPANGTAPVSRSGVIARLFFETEPAIHGSFFERSEVKRVFLKFILPAGTLLAAATAATAATQYQVAEIQGVGNHSFVRFSGGNAINNAGQVAGVWELSIGQRAFVTVAGRLENLGTLGGDYSFGSHALGINSSGQVTGFSYTGDERARGYVTRNGQMIELGNFGGIWTQGSDINDQGAVVGYSQNENGKERAFLSFDGVMTDLGTLGGTSSRTEGINNHGQIVGMSETADGQFHAFSFKDGVMSDIGTLGSESDALTVNDQGDIVGGSRTNSTNFHGFVFRGGTMTDLGTFGGSSSFATDINNAGQIVGYAEGLGGKTIPFVTVDGAITDLNTLLVAGSGWTIDTAGAINDLGQIAARAIDATGRYTLVVLSPSDLVPVPLPAAFWLLAPAVAGLGLFRRKST